MTELCPSAANSRSCARRGPCVQVRTPTPAGPGRGSQRRRARRGLPRPRAFLQPLCSAPSSQGRSWALRVSGTPRRVVNVRRRPASPRPLLESREPQTGLPSWSATETAVGSKRPEFSAVRLGPAAGDWRALRLAPPPSLSGAPVGAKAVAHAEAAPVERATRLPERLRPAGPKPAPLE